MLAAMLCFGTADALANCTTSGTTVICAAPGTTGFVAGGGVNGLNVTVQPGATVVDNGTDAIQINSTSNVTNNGTISLANGAAGIASLAGATNIVVNNGTIAAGNNGAGVFLKGSSSVTNNGTITGGSNTPAISMTTGATVLNAGTISVGNGSAGINVTTGGNITNSGSIAVTGGSVAAIKGTSGNTVINSGTLTVGGAANGIEFTNTNTITNSGTISVSAGTGIFVGNGNVITNTGTITTGAGGIGVVSDTNGTVTNSGTITAVGAGAFGVQLVDGGNTFNNFGIVRATNGATSLDICSCASLTTVTNKAGGTLDGKISIVGQDNTVINSGLITITDPSTSIAEFNFTLQNSNGSATTNPDIFQQTGSGVLGLRMDNAGNVDGIIADKIIAAGTVKIVIQPQLYPATLTSLTPAIELTPGTNPVTSAFNYTASSPFFTVKPIYDTSDPTSYNNVTIELDRVAFGSVPGLTPNQKATGNALESKYSPNLTGNAATFFGNLFAATSTNALDQLSGQGVSVSQNVAFDTQSMFNSTMMSQGAFWLGGNPVDAAGVSFAPLEFAQNDPRGNANAATDASHGGARPGRWRVWTLGFGSTSSLSGQSSSGSMTQTLQSAGGAFGIDHELSPDLLVGFAIGASNANFAAPSLATSGQSTGVHIGIYGSKTFGAIYLASALNYTHFDNSTTRAVSGIGTTETETGNFASHELGTRLELGWKRRFDGYTVTPFVAIEPSMQFQDGYTESSLTVNNTPGILGLSFASHTTTSVPTFVGAQINMRTSFDSGWTLEPFIRASWVHEFTPNRQVSASFVSVPTASFTVQGPAAPSDSARIEAGFTLGLNTKWSLYGNVTGDVSERSHGFAGTGGFRASW